MFCCLLLVPCHFILLFILPFYNRNINSKGSTIYVWLILSSHLFTSMLTSTQAFKIGQSCSGVNIPMIMVQEFCPAYTQDREFIRASVCASVCPSVRPSVTICFFNILKTHRWNFMKLYRHLDINGANMHMQKIKGYGPVPFELLPFIVLDGFCIQ